MIRAVFKKDTFIFCVVFLFFIIRIAAALFIGQHDLEGDELVYNNYAVNVLEDPSWFYSPSFLGDKREPLYPLFLAMAYLIFGRENFIAVYVIQALVSVCTILLTYRLALGIFGNRTAWIAFFWSGLYGFYIWFARLLLRESIIYFLFILLFYIIYRYLFFNFKDKKSRALCFFMALVYSLLIHTDFRYIYLIVPLALLFFIYMTFLQGVKKFCLFLFFMILICTPWAIRNYIAYNSFVPVTTIYLKPGAGFSNFKYLRKVTNTRTYNTTRNTDYPSSKERELIKHGINPNGRTAEEIKAIIKDIYPASTYWGRIWFNFRELWRPFMLHAIYKPFTNCGLMYWSLRHNIVSILSYGLLLPFAVTGAILMVVKKDRIVWVFLIPIFFHTLTHLFSWGEYRYRIPVDTFVIILGAYSLSSIYTYFSKMRNSYGKMVKN